MSERDDLKSTKDDLLQKITKVDREIAKAESQIAKLKKKQQELEECQRQANSSRSAASEQEQREQAEEERPRNQSTAQIIYADNRVKTHKFHIRERTSYKMSPSFSLNRNGPAPRTSPWPSSPRLMIFRSTISRRTRTSITITRGGAYSWSIAPSFPGEERTEVGGSLYQEKGRGSRKESLFFQGKGKEKGDLLRIRLFSASCFPISLRVRVLRSS